jgi:hypothetical protein
MNKLDKNSTKVSKKQKRIVKKHVEGNSNVEIGKAEYPNATPKSQRQIVYQELNKPAVRQYLEQSKLQAMKDHNIGWDRVMNVIDKGLDAKKTDHYSGQDKDDITTQLRAAKQASDYLELPKDTVEETKEMLSKLPDVDEIQLVRLMKK